MEGSTQPLHTHANCTACLCSSMPKIRNPTGILQHQYRKVAQNGVRIGPTDRLAMGVINLELQSPTESPGHRTEQFLLGEIALITICVN